jgi:addiction module RelB/DinJ family antitoxin
MKTAINIKVDKKVKESSQKLAEELGLSLSAVINASLKQFVRTKEVSFSISRKMTPYLERVIAEAEKDLREGNLAGPFTAKELMAHLKKA